MFKGKFPEQSTPFCNVVEFSNFVVKLLFVFLNVISPLTKKVAFHCSQLTLSLVKFVPSGPVRVVAL